MSQQTESASEMLRKLIDAVEAAHHALFVQCASNPIKNAWGKEVSVAALNDAREMAVGFSGALRAASQAPVGLRITKGDRDGNWQDFDVNGHGGLIRVVARMEDDDTDLPLGMEVERFLLGAAPASIFDVLTGTDGKGGGPVHVRAEQPAAQALTDARILEIAMGHFKPGHTVAAEKNFLACVRDILAKAAAQPNAKVADLIRFDFTNADRQPDSKMLTHDEMRQRCADALAAAQPSAKALTDEQRNKVRDAIAETLGGAYDCLRVWSAWGVGTMSQDDFALLVEDESRLAEITDAAIGAILAAEQPSEDKRNTAAARDVLAERRRQVTAEGWTPEHDDEHDEGELALAAAGYAQSASDQIQCVAKELDDSTLEDDGCPSSTFPHGWQFKAAPPRRMLVKAGALILAEIERIDRAAMAEQPTMMHTTPPCACVAYSLNKKDRA